MSKTSFSLKLTEQETQVLDDLCQKRGLTKTALLKQCLRLYQVIDLRIEAGEKLFFEDKDKNKSEMVMI